MVHHSRSQKLRSYCRSASAIHADQKDRSSGNENDRPYVRSDCRFYSFRTYQTKPAFLLLFEFPTFLGFFSTTSYVEQYFKRVVWGLTDQFSQTCCNNALHNGSFLVVRRRKLINTHNTKQKYRFPQHQETPKITDRVQYLHRKVQEYDFQSRLEQET